MVSRYRWLTEINAWVRHIITIKYGGHHVLPLEIKCVVMAVLNSFELAIQIANVANVQECEKEHNLSMLGGGRKCSLADFSD